MPEYTPGYMCDWCKASAATIDTIDHERDCPRPRILQMMEELASLHAENARLHNENEKLRAMIFDGGFDISPCRLCGKPIVCIPDGLPACESCSLKG